MTAKDGVVQGDLEKLFDLTNVEIDFDFKVIEKPMKIKSVWYAEQNSAELAE